MGGVFLLMLCSMLLLALANTVYELILGGVFLLTLICMLLLPFPATGRANNVCRLILKAKKQKAKKIGSSYD